ncbi:Beta-galactosidase [Tsuneonella dongtanensis]|uniref:Beta-galactosidase n=1 Tax=Tsuneonella dongtanensis TaxID=692370 RepID=A0A1B2A903_9SPHN|nr:hypothetical protein [Tsuneonella dongtanensis]ANY18640.1 Beta-galactosidase [Tsuneonella dongtanensis]
MSATASSETILHGLLDLSQGWYIWPDREAGWRNDTLHLPGTFDLAELQQRAPTGGWSVLDQKAANGEAAHACLPATVEQYFWGRWGKTRLSSREYFFAKNDPLDENGIYYGVSWFWHDFELPVDWTGRTFELHVPAARLRAEVFLNEQLIGYDVIGETPFSCDATAAVRLGARNRLAIRITNPGGRLDWCDFHDRAGADEPPTALALVWGEQILPLSHGFGGLDSGIELRATGPSRIVDIFFRNRADAGTADIDVQLSGDATCRCILRPCSDETVIWRNELITRECKASFEVRDAAVALWSPLSPTLYELTVECLVGNTVSDRRSVKVGFRWFTVTGIGDRAMFRINGKRIRLRSAISWNYWPGSGLFPSETALKAEIKAVRELGFNTLTAHRNIANARAIAAADRAGLLRWQEPGAGRAAWTGASAFERGYMREKIARMIRRDRNSPSHVVVGIQNEQVEESALDPAVRDILEMVRATDPTRIVVLKSGFAGAENVPEDMRHYADQQAYVLPGDPSYHHDRGDGWSGWWDNHTVGGPGVWQDWIYRSPQDFSHASDNRSEIVFWGEVLGSGSPDPLDCTASTGWQSDREELLRKGYDDFLGRRGWRPFFADHAALSREVAVRSAHFWARVIGNMRISDNVDGFALSGWESEPFEQHTGIVDLYRRPKAPPTEIARANRALQLVIKPRGLVHATSTRVIVDVYLVNDCGVSGSGILQLSAGAQEVAKRSVTISGGEVYAELLLEGIEILVGGPGYLGLHSGATFQDTELTATEDIFIVDWRSGPDIAATILEEGCNLASFLREIGVAPVQLFRAPVIVIQGRQALTQAIIDYAENGGRLVILADGSAETKHWARQFQNTGILPNRGTLGPAMASWTGSWYIAGEDSAVFAGLPSRCALGWEYQADPRGAGAWFAPDQLGRFADGLLLDNDDAQVLVVYGRDHQPELAAAMVRIPIGKGELLFSSIAGLYSSLSGTANGVHPDIARKWVRNLLTVQVDTPFGHPHANRC